MRNWQWLVFGLATALGSVSCRRATPGGPAVMDGAAATERPAAAADAKVACDGSPPLGTPIARQLFTADPSAHVFDGRLYVYPSHDLEHNPPANNQGDHFAMKDYHVLSFDSATCRFVDHGEALNVANVPWARKEMWAPDAAYKNGGYFLYFPAKDEHGVFRIGVATSATATGPFAARPTPITGATASIPPCSSTTTGRLTCTLAGSGAGNSSIGRRGSFQENAAAIGGDQAALGPRFAKLGGDMLSFDGPVEELSIVDAAGKPLRASDNQRRFFEGVWLHKYHGNLLSLVLHGRQPLPRVCDRGHAQRPVHLSRALVEPGEGLDHTSFDRGVQRQVVPVLSRRLAVR